MMQRARAATGNSKSTTTRVSSSRGGKSKGGRVPIYAIFLFIALFAFFNFTSSFMAFPTQSSELTHTEVKAHYPRQKASTGKAELPKAISLLDKPPPYKDSDITMLSDDIITSPNTVVTAYFKVPSKFKHDSYNGWIQNMLSLQDPMVIFTSPDLVPVISGFRNHATNRTVIISMDLNDLPIGALFSTDFWQNQLDRDPEKRIHRSYQLFWIWLSKSWWTMQAIKHNFFQSDLFFYSDMGCFRNKKYNDKTMILHRDQVPPNEMIQMAHHKPNPPNEVFFNDKYKKKDNFYHSGSQFAAYKDTWIKFHKYFLDTIDGFLERNMIIVEDQAILQSVCLRYPEICAYVPFNQVKPMDNHYFGLRYVVHNGGSFKLWRHPKNPLANN